MGILDAFLRNSQAVQQPWSPMAPQQQPQTMTGATPGGMNNPPPMQTPAFAQPLQIPQFGTPAAPQQGFRARLADMFNPNGENYLFNNPTFMNGLTLLGESQNGGDWGRAAQSISQNQTQQLQRTQLQRQNRREDAADAREQTQFGWQEGAQARGLEQRQALENWIRTLPPEQQAAARANPQAAHQAFMEAQAAASQPITPFQQAQLSLTARGQNMDFATSAAAQELRQRSLSLRGPDRDLMETIRNSSGSANELLGMAQMFREANSRTQTGGGSQFIPFSEDRASMRQVASMMRGMMRPVGSGATSDYEQRLYAMGVPSVDLLGPQNEAIINNIETLARIRNARRYFYEDYADQTGSLNGAERAFQASQEFRTIQAQNPVGQRRQATPPQRPAGVPATARWDASRQRWVN